MEVGGAAVLGGLAWFLLVPAAELEGRNLLSYDAYNRLLAVPLLFFVIASYLAPRALAVQGRLGFSVAAVGAGWPGERHRLRRGISVMSTVQLTVSQPVTSEDSDYRDG